MRGASLTASTVPVTQSRSVRPVAAAAAVAVLLAGCQASSGSSAPTTTSTQRQLTVHSATTCSHWSSWSTTVRVRTAGDMADAMGAYDTSRAFHAWFARTLLNACRRSQNGVSVELVAEELAATDPRDFSLAGPVASSHDPIRAS